MKAVMIAAPGSGSGKTTVTAGIIRALCRRGTTVSPYKTGPDYIDTAFLSEAAGRAAGNLDLHLMGSDGVKSSLALGGSEVAIIEGAMGYFDGVGNTFGNSSFDIAKTIGVKTILVYSPKGQMFSAVPQLKGIIDFAQGTIAAIIFNGIKKGQYEMLKGIVEQHCNVPVIGFMPEITEVSFKSRHLGLIQSVEVDDLEQRIDRIADQVEESLDLDYIMSVLEEFDFDNTINIRKREVTVAVAFDKAFSFYYSENLRLLEKTCNVKYFSPLCDSELPECDLVYIGGGYPEVFSDILAGNTSMLSSVKQAAENGMHIYAECGGLMYLTEAIDGIPMTGVLRGSSRMTPELQRFGYIDIALKRDCLLGKAGDKLTAHEFHRSTVDTEQETVYSVKKTQGTRSWECGYSYKNVLGAYPHINFYGNLKAFEAMLDNIEGGKMK